MVWPETLSQTPWLINKSAGGPPFNNDVIKEVIIRNNKGNNG